jgi:hypothetical protein
LGEKPVGQRAFFKMCAAKAASTSWLCRRLLAQALSACDTLWRAGATETLAQLVALSSVSPRVRHALRTTLDVLEAAADAGQDTGHNGAQYPPRATGLGDAALRLLSQGAVFLAHPAVLLVLRRCAVFAMSDFGWLVRKSPTARASSTASYASPTWPSPRPAMSAAAPSSQRGNAFLGSRRRLRRRAMPGLLHSGLCAARSSLPTDSTA